MDYQEEDCLFCEEICCGTAHPGQILFSGSRYLGKDCPSLESQLKQLFILRRILDIPLEWCEEKLGGSEGDNPSNWFGICGGCTPIVEEAVDVHHKILKLEDKFQKLKEKVKEKMGSGRSRRRRRRERGDQEGNVREEIRKLVIGEEAVLVKSEVEKPTYTECDEDENDDDDDFDIDQEDDQDSCSDPEWSEGNRTIMEEDEKVELSQSQIPTKMRKRGPGRPPRGEERPRDFYLGKGGKVRHRTFSWQTCLKCPAKYKYSKDLSAHSSLHDSPKSHSCPECNYPFKTKDELERHHKAKHEGRTSYYIPRYGCVSKDCQFATYTRSHLDNHCSKEHPSMSLSDLKRMKCPRCPRNFGTKKSLGVHQHRWHPELFGMEPLPPTPSTSGPIKCEHCGIFVASLLHLDNHVRSTHERVQRHICEECGKGFRAKGHLEAHMIVHRKEREFVCQYCGLDYPAKATLADHIRKIHSEKEGGGGGEESGQVFTCKYCELTSPFKVVIRRHQLTHKVEMGFQCDICQKCYTNNAGLKRHYRINHPTQKEVVECPYCKKPFGNKDYMNDHMKKFCQVRKNLEAGKGEEGKNKLEKLQ